MTIGERIKMLRRRNDLTQEKLAEYLSVSSQAVSKWECGLACPDLALIVPLTKILHVSADELLGLTPEEQDERKAYFEEEYHQYWLKTNHDADLEIAKQAVSEYPEEYKYLEWLASVEWYVGYSIENIGTEKSRALLESSIRHYQIILEDCKDATICNKAISGIVWDYSVLEQYEEAKKYAEMYPEKPELTRDELIARCLKGNELAALRRKITYEKFNDFCSALHDMWKIYDMRDVKAMEMEEAVIRIIIDDDNYLKFNWNLYFISLQHAIDAVVEKRYEDAVKSLYDARKYAIGFDTLDEAGISTYTCTLFEGYKVDVHNSRNETGTYLEWLKETITEKKDFAPLRDREDFRRLMESF